MKTFQDFTGTIARLMAIVVPFFLIIQTARFIIYKYYFFKSIIQDFLKNPYANYIGAFSVVYFGILFFAYKKKQQFWYGVTETFLSTVACYVAFVRLSHAYSVEILVAIVTTAYFVTRGLENTEKGYGAEKFAFKKRIVTFWLFISPELKPLLIRVQFILSFCTIYFSFKYDINYDLMIFLFAMCVIPFLFLEKAFKN